MFLDAANLRSSLFMANGEDFEAAKIGTYEILLSDSEREENLSPITTKTEYKENNRERKRSASLPFMEDHSRFYKGLVATKGLKITEEKGKRHGARNSRNTLGNDSEIKDETEDTLYNLKSEGCSTRRSSSMPEFYQFTRNRRQEIPSKQFWQKQCGGDYRKWEDKPLVSCLKNDLERKDDTLKLPIISTSSSSKNLERQHSPDIEEVESGHTKIQRKTYLPRINTNSGNIFMKKR